MKALYDHLKIHPITYVSRDRERASGLASGTQGYSIIADSGALAKPKDTWELLKDADTSGNIVVFKNTPQIERISEYHGFKLLNPPAELAGRVEEKISQVEWLGELGKHLPAHKITTCGKINWENESFVLQFNRAHTGEGTFLIESEKQLGELKEKFPDRPVRLTDFIDGPMFTNNNVVHSSGVLSGNISYQITGISPYTENRFATIGNDWALPHDILDKDQKKQFEQIAKDVGEKLRKDGWKGLFGIDVVLNEKNGKLYLIEINARQPASTIYESKLQKTNTIFEAHLAALLDLDLSDFELTKIHDGAQLFDRHNETVRYFTHSIMQSHNEISV